MDILTEKNLSSIELVDMNLIYWIVRLSSGWIGGIVALDNCDHRFTADIL